MVTSGHVVRSMGSQKASIEDSPISNHDTYAREAETPETLGKLTHQETFKNSRREGRPRTHQNMKRRNTQRMNTTQRQLIWNSPRARHPLLGRSPAPVSHERKAVSAHNGGLMTCRKGADIQASGKPPPSSAGRVCVRSRVARRRRHTAQPQRHWSVGHLGPLDGGRVEFNRLVTAT